MNTENSTATRNDRKVNHRNTSADTPKWAAARELATNGEAAQVNVISVATNATGRPCGLNVTVCELPAFLPGSELPKGVNQSGLVGTTITAKVIEVNRRKGRLIVSRTAIAAVEQKSFLESLVENSDVEGTVARKTDFGYFINLGPVDGLLHVSQVQKDRVLNIGETVTVKVRGVNVEEGKVSLTTFEKRPENAGNGSNGGRNGGSNGGNGGSFGRTGARHGNAERFTRRQPTITVSVPKASKPTTTTTDTGTRKLNTKKSGSGKKRDQFTHSFTSFEALAGFMAARTAEVEAPVAETPVVEAAPAVETPVAE